MRANHAGLAGSIPQYTDYQALRGHPIGLTGARGVLGGLLQRRLERNGVEAAAYPGDINDPAALSAWFAGRSFRYFFHFAALVPVAAVEANPLLAYQTNVVGTFNVCRQLLHTHGRSWLFHCSSSHVYRPTAAAAVIDEEAVKDPPSFYGATKLAAERVVETLLGKFKADYCIGRVFSFTHALQTAPYLVPSLRQKIAALGDGEVLEIDNPGAVRDLQDAEQVIDAILHLTRRTTVGTVNIGTGRGQSVREIAIAVAQELGKKIQVRGVDRTEPGSLVADVTRLHAALKNVGAEATP